MKKRWMMFVGRLLLVTMLFTAVTEPVFAMPEDQVITEEATEVVWGDDMQAEEAEAALEEAETIPEKVSTEVTESGEELTDGVEEEPATDEVLPEEEILAEASDHITFTIEAVDLMYGEDGSNANGNLDRLFAPRYVVDGVENADVQVAYKFFLSVSEQDADAETIRDFLLQNEGENLADIPAGSCVLVAAFADDGSGNDPAIATQTITITRRKLIAHLVQSEDLVVSTKEMPEDETVSIGEQDEAYKNVSIEVVENRPASTEIGDVAEEDGAQGAGEEEAEAEEISTFAHADEILENPEDVIEGEITLDVSGVDTDETGFQEVPVEAEMAEELTDNYEWADELLGYIYVEQPRYYITVSIVTDGKLVQDNIENAVTTNTALKSYPGFQNLVYDVTGPNNGLITSWTVYKNGFKWRDIDSDFKYGGSDFEIEPKQDYYLVPRLYRNTTQNLYVDAIPAVYYDRLSHVCRGETLSMAAKKSKIADVDIRVFTLSDADIVSGNFSAKKYLRYGTDYKVTFKNNKDASVHVGEAGKLLGIYESDFDPGELKKRPCATITGVGNYTGLTATVYFDILPVNIGEGPYTPTAEITGLKGTYTLKNGKVSGINPKVTIGYAGDPSATTLKKGTDYDPALYKYNDYTGIWDKLPNADPNKITVEGRYLYVVNGINNYCGTAFGQTGNTVFNPYESGVNLQPKVCEYNDENYANAQFIVRPSGNYDLANATVSVGKTSLPYERGKYYDGDDFKITVRAGGIKLEQGVDYDIFFDGTDYQRPIERNIDITDKAYKTYRFGTDACEFTNSIFIANNYRVKIVAHPGSLYYGSKDTGKSVRIKGTKINPKWFKLASPSLKYDGNYSTGGSFTIDYKAEVDPLDSDTDFGNFIIYYSHDSTKNYYSSVNYLKGMKYIHENSLSYSKNPVKVMVTQTRGKLPGTYATTVNPLGPGVDMDSLARVEFKRVGITTKEAVKEGILKVEADPSAPTIYNNAGGAFPSKLNITYGGSDFKKTKSCTMVCSCQSFNVTDSEGSNITITVEATNNKSVGTGYLTVTGDGKVLKGKATKAAQFEIYSNPVSGMITCLSASDYLFMNGKRTDQIHETLPGTIYAIVGTAAKPKNGSTPVPGKNITLVQSYYKTDSDARAERGSLATIPANKYKLTLTPNGANKYTVTVSNGSSAGYSFPPSTLYKDYTVYESAVKITGIEVKYYEQPDSYPYPDDILRFPEDKNRKLPFTGARYDETKLEVDKVFLNVNGMVVQLGPEYFTVEYGDNLASGKGTIKVILKYSDYFGTYDYGGNATFNFTIDKGVNVTM